MSIFTDETRRIMRSMDKEYKLEQEAWIPNAEMTQAGNWIILYPVALKLYCRYPTICTRCYAKSFTQYRKLAWKLIQHFKQCCD